MAKGKDTRVLSNCSDLAVMNRLWTDPMIILHTPAMLHYRTIALEPSSLRLHLLGLLPDILHLRMMFPSLRLEHAGRVVRGKLAGGDTSLEHVVELFEASPFELWEEKVDK